MVRVIKKAFRFLSDIGSSCPYTMLGKKVIRFARCKRDDEKKYINDNERNLLKRIKTGRNIALIGFFCPIFWISLFSGARGQELYFNAVHSGIVVLIGLGLMIISRLDLEKEKIKRRPAVKNKLIQK